MAFTPEQLGNCPIELRFLNFLACIDHRPKDMTKMLRVERMASRAFAQQLNDIAVNVLIRILKSLGDKWLPILGFDWPDRIVHRGTVKRTRLIQKHRLQQMLAAAKKNVGNVLVMLDAASKLPLSQLIFVLQDLLKLIKYNHYRFSGFLFELLRCR
jgi:hypothetical protein